MESLDEKDVVEQKTRVAAPDRVALGKSESEKLNSWIEQANLNSKGFLELSKSDVVNFLIREHKVELSPRELARLRASHYDPVRHISWITQELRSALTRGDDKMVASLQEEIRKIELSPGTRAEGAESVLGAGLIKSCPRTRQKRSKKQDGQEMPNSQSDEATISK